MCSLSGGTAKQKHEATAWWFYATGQMRATLCTSPDCFAILNCHSAPRLHASAVFSSGPHACSPSFVLGSGVSVYRYRYKVLAPCLGD